MFHPSPHTPLPSPLTSYLSLLTPLPLTPHPSPLTSYLSLLTPHILPLTPHPSHSPLTPHPSHLTSHSSPLPLTPHPSHLTSHSSPLTPGTAAPSVGRSLGSAPTLWDLMNEVAAPVPAKLWGVAIGLGLEMADVNRIQEESRGRCDRAYSAVFDTWKRQQSSSYTWRSVVECLQSPSVDEQKIARQIKEKCK